MHRLPCFAILLLVGLVTAAIADDSPLVRPPAARVDAATAVPAVPTSPAETASPAANTVSPTTVRAKIAEDTAPLPRPANDTTANDTTARDTEVAKDEAGLRREVNALPRDVIVLPSALAQPAAYPSHTEIESLTKIGRDHLLATEVRFRDVEWPRLTDKRKQPHVRRAMSDPALSNAALSDAVVSTGYDLGPVLLDLGDRWQGDPIIVREFFTIEDVPFIRNKDHYAGALAATAASLAALGFLEDASAVSAQALNDLIQSRSDDDELIKREVARQAAINRAALRARLRQ